MAKDESSTNNIVLIIIDQLRADYGQYLPKISKLLSHSAISDTNSIPTSTEAMHANISTGLYPRVHGLISKETRRGKGGLDDFVETMRVGEVPCLASLANENGFNIYVMGGKPETVRVMGLEQMCSLTLYKGNVKDGEKNYIIDGVDVLLVEEFNKLLNSGREETSDKERDFEIIEIFNQAIKGKQTGNSFFVITLPSLDWMGHEYAPSSTQIVNHLGKLDAELSSVVRQMDANTTFIVTGDHGCRYTTEYVVEADEDNSRVINVYCKDGDTFRFIEGHELGEDEVEQVRYGGGILRIWFNQDVNHLSENDSSFLSKYGQIIYDDKEASIDENLRRIYENSKHANLGHVVVLSNSNTSFCKRGWVEECDEVYEKIDHKLNLLKGNLPLGEHGSDLLQDREAYFTSNYNFGINRLYNIEIRRFIKEIMNLSRF